MITKEEITADRLNGLSWKNIGKKYNVNKGVIFKFYQSGNSKFNDHSKPRYTDRPLMPVWNIFQRCYNKYPHEIIIKFVYATCKKYSIKCNREACIDHLLDRWFGLSKKQYKKWSDKPKSYISGILVSDIFHYVRKYKTTFSKLQEEKL